MSGASVNTSCEKDDTCDYASEVDSICSSAKEVKAKASDTGTQKVKPKSSGRTKKVVVVPESHIMNDKIRVLLLLCLYGNGFPIKLLGLTSMDDSTMFRVTLYSSKRCTEESLVTSAEISIESIEYYIIRKNDKKIILPSNLYEKVEFLTKMVDTFGTCTRFQLHHGCKFSNL